MANKYFLTVVLLSLYSTLSFACEKIFSSQCDVQKAVKIFEDIHPGFLPNRVHIITEKAFNDAMNNNNFPLFETDMKWKTSNTVSLSVSPKNTFTLYKKWRRKTGRLASYKLWFAQITSHSNNIDSMEYYVWFERGDNMIITSPNIHTYFSRYNRSQSCHNIKLPRIQVPRVSGSCGEILPPPHYLADSPMMTSAPIGGPSFDGPAPMPFSLPLYQFPLMPQPANTGREDQTQVIKIDDLQFLAPFMSDEFREEFFGNSLNQ